MWPGQHDSGSECLAESVRQRITTLCSPVSKAPPAPADSLDLFPNPTSGDATLRYGGIQVEQIRIFDGAGKLVQTLENLGKESTELKLGELPVGIYTLRIVTNEGNLSKKLAVVR